VLVAALRQVASVIRRRPFDTSTPEGRSRERYRRVALTFAASVAGRGVAVVATLLMVPVLLGHLGPERYGLWAALSTAAAALVFADLGIGNGLLSLLAEDSGRDDTGAARRHVSSSFAALLVLAGLLAVVFLLVHPRVEWARLLRADSPSATREVAAAVGIFGIWFLASLPLGLVTRVRLARQEGFTNGLWAAGGTLLGVALMLGAISAGAGLPGLVAALGAGPLLALLGQNAALFLRQPALRPRLREARVPAAARVLRLGFAFFVLQVAAAVLHASDGLVAAIVIGPEAAARYAVAAALFDLPLSLLAMMLTPFWPAYGEALARRDVAWMRRALRRSLLLAGVFGLAGGALLFAAGAPLVRWWVGSAMVPEPLLLAGLAVRLVLLCLLQAIAVFLNGARLLRLQLVCGCLMAAAAIALKVALAARVGLPGVAAGTVIALASLGLVPYLVALRRWHLPREVGALDPPF
jgi:O-antigen/teichoic acid export membrane protein